MVVSLASVGRIVMVLWCGLWLWVCPGTVVVGALSLEEVAADVVCLGTWDGRGGRDSVGGLVGNGFGLCLTVLLFSLVGEVFVEDRNKVVVGSIGVAIG